MFSWLSYECEMRAPKVSSGSSSPRSNALWAGYALRTELSLCGAAGGIPDERQWKTVLEGLHWRQVGVYTVSYPGGRMTKDRHGIGPVVAGILVILAGLMAMPQVALGQGTARGTLVGTVTDPSGALAAGVVVTVTNLDTGIKQESTTSDAGVYTVPNLPVGNYSVTAEQKGFKRALVTNIRLEVGATYRADIKLEVGEVATQVTVEALAPLLHTDDAEVSHLIEKKRVVDLPLNGRDFQQLQLLTPGAVNTVNFQTGSGLLGGASALTTTNSLNVSNGARPGSQLFLIDGGDATNQRARTIIVTPDIDEIEEFRVAGSNFSAEYGYGTNVVNVSTKSGTNDLHATAWYFNRNDTFAARSFFASSVADLRRHQTGVSIGGPVIRNRTFFFFSYEGQRETAGRISIATVPTAKMRGGDLSELPQTIFDPITSQFNAQGIVTRQPLPGNIIPRARLDSISQLFLDWIPLPNTSGIVGNFRIQPSAHNDYNHYTAKMDHLLTSKDSLMARWTYRPANFPNSIGPYDGFSKDDYSPGTIFKNTDATSAVAAWTRVISPTTHLEVRGSYSAPFVDYLNVNIKPGGTDWTDRAGIQGFGPGVSDGFPMLPNFSVTGFTGLPTGTGFQVNDNNYNFSANLTMIRGAHSLKVGNAYRTYQGRIFPYGTPGGEFSFTGDWTRNPSQSGASGSGLADYLLGVPFSAGRYVPPGCYYMRWNNTWTFVQDDWKVSPNLTVNLGLRYEINFPTVEKYNQLATWTPFARNGRGAMVIPDEESVTPKYWAIHPSIGQSLSTYRPLIITAEQAGIPRRSLRFTNYKQFAPRFGIAYRLRDDMTVRTGYGIYLNQLDGNRESEFLSPPFLIRESGLLNPPDQNGGPSRTTQNMLPKDSRFDPIPTILAHDPWNRGYGQTHQWNLTIQKLLPAKFVGEIGYVGTKGNHLQTSRNFNIPQPGPGAIQPRRPYNEFGNITWNEQAASSIYHSLQSKIERRFTDGLTILGAFTWSRSIDDSSSTEGRNPFLGRGNRGPSLFDVPLNFTMSAIYELPFFKNGGSPAAKHVLGGWSLAGIMILQSGFPFTPSWAGDITNTGVGTPPNRICDGRLDNPTLDRWFDTSCFVQPAPFTFGNTSRNVLRGDGYENLDFAVYKSFSITEQHRAQIRVEFFNALNHPNFGFPAAAVNVQGAGRVLVASPGRIIQFGAKYSF